MEHDEHDLAVSYRYGFIQEAEISIPRMSLNEFKHWKSREMFLHLMKKHSFVIVTEIGSYAQVYGNLVAELEGFFKTASDQVKEQCTSKKVYRNENGTPMWYCGYESTSVRNCFRIAAGAPDQQQWPSDSFRNAWLKLLRLLQRLCDRCLSFTEGYSISPTSRDFSVCYGLHYPNTLGTGQSEAENVYEHVDPSLYVVEPVCSVEGLEVFDQFSQQWISAEAIGDAGKELIVFGGKALEKLTQSEIKGTLHRVIRSTDERCCFIYEQKYQEYY